MRDPANLMITLGDHTDTDALVLWLSGSFADLETRAQGHVDEYWSRFKNGRTAKQPKERGSLGLRLRTRVNGSFSIEWYETTYLGKSSRSIAKNHIRKGRSHRYALKAIMASQPSWMIEIITETEDVLAEIRRRQALLVKIRQAVTNYAREVGGIKPRGLSDVGSETKYHVLGSSLAEIADNLPSDQ